MSSISRLAGRRFDLDDLEVHRRTLYATVSRHRLHPYLSTFDVPDPLLSESHRHHTEGPNKFLFFLNSEFVKARAQAIVKKLFSPESIEGATPASTLTADATTLRVDALYQQIFGRPPTELERDLAKVFVHQAADDETSVWTEYCLSLLSTQELRWLP